MALFVAFLYSERVMFTRPQHPLALSNNPPKGAVAIPPEDNGPSYLS